MHSYLNSEKYSTPSPPLFLFAITKELELELELLDITFWKFWIFIDFC